MEQLKIIRQHSQKPDDIVSSRQYYNYVPIVSIQLQYVQVSYRILSWGGQDDSRMIVACNARLHLCKCVCLLEGVWGHAPQEDFEFRSSQIASDTIWDKLSK